MNKRSTTQQLLVVYNAQSDLFSSLTDFAHKILSPATYQCELCTLTHGHFTIKQDWKLFLQTLPIETVFLYRDEFLKHYKMHAAFPAIFIKESEKLKPFINKQEIEGCETLEKLKELVSIKLSVSASDGN